MLSTVLGILVVLWLLNRVTSYTLGGFVHILLVVAIPVVLVRVIRGEPRCAADGSSPSGSWLNRFVEHVLHALTHDFLDRLLDGLLDFLRIDAGIALLRHHVLDSFPHHRMRVTMPKPRL